MRLFICSVVQERGIGHLSGKVVYNHMIFQNTKIQKIGAAVLLFAYAVN